MWGYGTDRKKAYDSMINKQSYRDQLDVNPDFKGYEIFRTDDNISASKVRNALKIDDEKTFKKMTPKSIHKFYKSLQDILGPIKESKQMKNLKSINEFAVNEKEEEKEMPTPDEPNVDTSGGTIKEMKIEGKDYNAVLSTFDAIGAKQKAMGKDIVGLISLPGENEVYELLDEEVKESLNEEYIEIMPCMEEGLEMIVEGWVKWKTGPMTEPKDIKPARKELLNFCMAYLKKNVK